MSDAVDQVHTTESSPAVPSVATPEPIVPARSTALDSVLDPELELLVPADDVDDPELSIVIPALNESLTICDFVAWCHEGLAAAGIVGEILIIDSSTDDTAELALAGGARVLKAPKRGLGRAYIDAIPYIRGKYVLMGDCDCTYDFRELKPFVDAFRDGYEFVMGSRWKGSIEKGAMPPLHRYLGTPVTTWILNVVFSSKFSDIHCGMRGLTRDALVNMEIRSQSWEYASEMVLKSVQMKLRTTEVPVRFLADRDGRLSHHKRSGWFSPFAAAWINLRAMFVYGAEFFGFRPGLVLFVVGLPLTLIPTFGPVVIGPVGLSLNWQLFGLVVSLVGLEAFVFGCISRVLFDYTGDARRDLLRLFAYNRTVLIALLLALAGVALLAPLTVRYLTGGLHFEGEISTIGNQAVTGSFFVITGFTLFMATLMINAASLVRPPPVGSPLVVDRESER